MVTEQAAVPPTPKEIEDAAAYWNSREGQAERLLNRAKRLHTFCKLNAPELLIESERQLICDSLKLFPVNEDAKKSKLEMDSALRTEEIAFLSSHGFFKDCTPIAFDDLKPGDEPHDQP